MTGYFAALLPATADGASDIAEVKAATTALDDAFEKRDLTMIPAMVTPDYRAVTSYYGDPWTTADEIAALPASASRFTMFRMKR